MLAHWEYGSCDLVPVRPRARLVVTQDVVDPMAAISPPQTAALPSYDGSAILDAVPAGIFVTDADGRCLFVNQRWQAYAGVSAEAALGFGWMEAIHPADREHIVAESEAAVRAGSEFAIEFRFLRPNGTTLWATGHAVPIRAADGPVTGYIATVTDVSELSLIHI